MAAHALGGDCHYFLLFWGFFSSRFTWLRERRLITTTNEHRIASYSSPGTGTGRKDMGETHTDTIAKHKWLPHIRHEVLEHFRCVLLAIGVYCYFCFVPFRFCLLLFICQVCPCFIFFLLLFSYYLYPPLLLACRACCFFCFFLFCLSGIFLMCEKGAAFFASRPKSLVFLLSVARIDGMDGTWEERKGLKHKHIWTFVFQGLCVFFLLVCEELFKATTLLGSLSFSLLSLSFSIDHRTLGLLMRQ